MMELIIGFSAFAQRRVQVCDSLRSSLTRSSRKSIRSLYKHYVADEGEQIETFLSVLKQSDGHNCGPFAIAYVAEIRDGRSPSEAVFDVNKMSEHLITCLEMQRLTPFPEVPNQLIYFNTFCYYVCSDFLDFLVCSLQKILIFAIESIRD